MGPRRIAPGPAPFGLSTVIAVADTSFHVGTQESYEIRSYGKDGRLRRILRRRLPPEPVSGTAKAEWERRADARVARLQGRAPPEVLEAFRYRAFPEFFPAFGKLLVDRAGNLWVEDYRPFAGPDSLLVRTQ